MKGINILFEESMYYAHIYSALHTVSAFTDNFKNILPELENEMLAIAKHEFRWDLQHDEGWLERLESQKEGRYLIKMLEKRYPSIKGLIYVMNGKIYIRRRRRSRSVDTYKIWEIIEEINSRL